LEIIGGLLEEYEVFDGKTLSSCEVVQATWCISEAQKSYVAQFRVVPNAPFDVLFGKNFLRNYPHILDSKEAKSKSAKSVLVLVSRKKKVITPADNVNRVACSHEIRRAKQRKLRTTKG
jgi:hypothetical protein